MSISDLASARSKLANMLEHVMDMLCNTVTSLFSLVDKKQSLALGRLCNTVHALFSLVDFMAVETSSIDMGSSKLWIYGASSRSIKTVLSFKLQETSR